MFALIAHPRLYSLSSWKVLKLIIAVVGAIIFIYTTLLLTFPDIHQLRSLDVGDEHDCSFGPMPQPVWKELASSVPTEGEGGRDVQRLSVFWENLTDLFHLYPPSPRRILRPTYDRPSDIGSFTQESADSAFGIDSAQALETRRAHQRVMKSLPAYSDSSTSPHFQGRGIAILGGGQYSYMAATSLAILRYDHQSTLPVEIWMGYRSEENQAWEDDFGALGATVRYLSDYATLGGVSDWWNPVRWMGKPRPWSPYQWKIMVLLFSSFEEVLFLDADSVPAKDPRDLFESQAYNETGVMLWPDYHLSINSRWTPYLVGLTETASETMWHQRTAEAGQIMWDKRRHWKSLLLACYYNFYGPGFWYTAITGSEPGWGDKDTFRIALEATRETFILIPDHMRGVSDYGKNVYMFGTQFTPKEPDEAGLVPAFYHACGGPKWSLASFLDIWNRNRNPWTYLKTKFLSKSAELNLMLHEGGRIFETLDDLPGVDPEVLMWHGLEYTACWSRIHGSMEACAWVRDRMTSSLGNGSGRRGSIHTCK